MGGGVRLVVNISDDFFTGFFHIMQIKICTLQQERNSAVSTPSKFYNFRLCFLFLLYQGPWASWRL